MREGKASELATARRGLEARPDLLAAGPVAVLWGVVDKIVDDYEPVVRGLETDVEQVEETVFSDTGGEETQRIYFLKRQLSDFYRTVHPLLAPLESEGNLRVSERWDSREQFAAFGECLMPVLSQAGIEFAGEPEIFETHNIEKR